MILTIGNRVMKMNTKYFFIFAILILFSASELFGQLRITQRGTPNFRKVGVHRGNQVRTVFSNYGVIAQPGNEGPRGAWKYDANGYVGDVSPLVGLRLPVRDYRKGSIPLDGIPDTIYTVVITPVDRPGGGESGGGKSYTFEPIPGFTGPDLGEVGKGVAMSHQPETWPIQWPDYPDWSYSVDNNGDGKPDPIIIDGVDKTPAVDWNGYFGRAQLTADQESYFWMDDNNDEENFLQNDFLPDANDPSRRGHALQVSVRGLQWSNFLAQDVIFWLYNITNDGTENYDQAVFSTIVGTYVGVEGNEWNDDVSYFNVRESITYTWDFYQSIRKSDNPQWLPDPNQVGYIAYAFLESPGNGVDGIDNDADELDGVSPEFVANDFPGLTPFVGQDLIPPVNAIAAGDKLVLIDKDTFQRTLFTMPNDTVTVTSMGVKFFLRPGVTKLIEGNVDQITNFVNENARDGIDNDLDGLIDENYQVHYRQYKATAPPNSIVLINELAPVKYIDYKSGYGITIPKDLMIDEKRDDLIDNDGDWDPEFDDVGADGKPKTNDFGENDGIPTPGEPNFDATDIDESDQIGLTSFEYYVPAGNIRMSDDIDMWRRMKPGFFVVPTSITTDINTGEVKASKGEDGDFIYGSGYFPLLAGRTERFSLALAFGADYNAVLKAKQIAQTIYDANYNFPKPPDKPTVTAVAENGKITLYWDRVAEESVDPTLRVKDFEGYKIYKGTDPDLTDALQITNMYGEKIFYKPIAQFDLINGIKGIFPSSPTLAELVSGTSYNLGTDNGIQNFYVDTDVINGRMYYYAVVAYDRGEPSKDIYPSENTRYISKDALGNISTDINTVAIRPNAPVAGYVPPESGVALNPVEGFTTVKPYFEVIDPIKVIDQTYTVTFNDSLRIKGSERTPVNISTNYSVQDEAGNFLVTKAPFDPTNGIVFNGVRLSIDSSYQTTDSLKLIRPGTNQEEGSLANDSTGWSTYRQKNLRYIAEQFVSPTISSTRFPRDYMLVFSNAYQDSSNRLTKIFGNSAPPVKIVNFKIYDITDKNNAQRVQFAFTEQRPYRRDTLSFGDLIILSDPTGSDFSWRIAFVGTDSSEIVPAGGDTLFLRFLKPISGDDKFVFTPQKGSYDVSAAQEQLSQVRAVPNPYVVSNVFEQPLPPTVRGRGERIINFINVPPGSKISIYTSSGDHVRTLEHNGDINNGSVTWDVRTKEGLDVAYGVYFYVVEVEGISDKKTGKLAIIK
jgi:hypothetical protein